MSEGILDELQKKISGETAERFTPVQINQLFRYPITPEFILLLYKGLQVGTLDPDVTVLQIIPHATNNDYIIPIALALRFGADSNMYVTAPKLGTIHILGYVYNSLANQNDNILNTIVLLLLAQGSLPSLPMYDKSAGKITDQPSTSVSVIDWLNSQGYNTILNKVTIGDPGTLSKYVDQDSLNMLAILLDRESLSNHGYLADDFVFVVKAFSSSFLDNITVPVDSLDIAVTYFNLEAYSKLLARGKMPSYVLVNKILIAMQKYKTSGNLIIVGELEKMLSRSVAMGVQLDQYQLAMVSSMGQEVLTSINSEYQQPYWKKVCKSTDTQATDQLKRLAVSLNIDPSIGKAGICENLTNLSRADAAELKDAARRRQQLRMAADLGAPTDFIGNNIPTVVCRNRQLLPQDPLDYNDLDLAYYKDAQGAVWCFTSESFPSLLESGMNPYNMVSLPETFMAKLKCQSNMIRELNSDVDLYLSKKPNTYANALNSLNGTDNVSEDISEQQLRRFVQLANSNGMNNDEIRALTKERMSRALKSAGYYVDLEPLSTQHALVTTSWIINNLPEQTVRNFFNSLNSI